MPILLAAITAPCFGQTTSAPAPKQQPLSLTRLPLNQARTQLEGGEITDAERTVREFLKTNSDSGEAHFLLGYILFVRTQQDAQKTLEGHRDNYQPSNHAESKAGTEEALSKASLAEFTEGARHQHPTAFDLKIVALDYVALGDYADADKWLTQSLQMNQQDEQAWYYLARTKYNENRFAEAVQAFQQCLKFDPKSVKYEDNLGLALAGLGRNEEALIVYKTAIAWQSDAASRDIGPYLNTGSLLLDMDHAQDSLPFLQQASEISPQNSKAHELLGKAYVRLNQLSQAQLELEKAVSLAPQVTSLHCMLGPVYRKQGITDKAKVEFEKCSAQTESLAPVKSLH